MSIPTYWNGLSRIALRGVVLPVGHTPRHRDGLLFLAGALGFEMLVLFLYALLSHLAEETGGLVLRFK